MAMTRGARLPSRWLGGNVLILLVHSANYCSECLVLPTLGGIA